MHDLPLLYIDLHLKFLNKNVLLFDLDGTLVDSVPDLASAVNKTLVELGRTPFNEEIIRGWVGNGAKVLIQRALSGSDEVLTDLSEVQLERALEIFFKAYQLGVCINTKLYTGVLDTLTALKAAGYRLAIITNKPERFVGPIVNNLALNGLFELIIGGDTLEKSKPDPLPLYHAVSALAVTAEQCVMIGDSKNDILAAKAANIDSVGLTYGYNYGEDIAKYHPELVLDNFANLLHALT